MELTKHAQKRVQQRGFSAFTVGIIAEFGRTSSAPGGAEKIFVGKKEYQLVIQELKRAIQLIDRAKGGYLIVRGNKILTVYRQ